MSSPRITLLLVSFSVLWLLIAAQPPNSIEHGAIMDIYDGVSTFHFTPTLSSGGFNLFFFSPCVRMQHNNVPAIQSWVKLHWTASL